MCGRFSVAVNKKDLTEYTEYLEDYMLSLAKKNKRFEES